MCEYPSRNGDGTTASADVICCVASRRLDRKIKCFWRSSVCLLKGKAGVPVPETWIGVLVEWKRAITVSLWQCLWRKELDTENKYTCKPPYCSPPVSTPSYSVPCECRKAPPHPHPRKKHQATHRPVCHGQNWSFCCGLGQSVAPRPAHRGTWACALPTHHHRRRRCGAPRSAAEGGTPPGTLGECSHSLGRQAANLSCG